MSLLPKATLAAAPRSRAAAVIPTIYAGVVVVVLVAQLFTFDAFTELLPALQFPFDSALVYAIAPAIVVGELFALPFLLRIAVSPAFRWVSMVCGWLVAASWFAISVWTLATASASTIGLLGSVVGVSAGVGLGVSIVFAGLALYSSWALWPGRRSRVHTAKK